MTINYKELKVWSEAHSLTIEILKFLEKNDLNRNYRLKDQLQGSLISIESNIAEGSKGTTGELRRYLRIALNSATEVETQLLILKDMSYINIEIYTYFQKKLDFIIGGLINYIKKIN